MINYKVIENALPESLFRELKEIIEHKDFPWYYAPYVSNDEDNGYFYFVHWIFYGEPLNIEQHNTILAPVLSALKITTPLKAKLNLFTKVPSALVHGEHTDYTDKTNYRTAILYIDTNNGGTKIGHTIIESMENRLLIMESDCKHASVSQTISKRRILYNINYEI